jgi:hypothetical protein
LPPGGIIEVVAVEWFAPIIEDPNETSVCECRCSVILDYKGYPVPGERGSHHHVDVIEDELSLDPHLQFATIAVELPGIEPA